MPWLRHSPKGSMKKSPSLLEKSACFGLQHRRNTEIEINTIASSDLEQPGQFTSGS
jgi:hypothetical protein